MRPGKPGWSVVIEAIDAHGNVGVRRNNSERNSWLQDDFPREDGAPRRPLPLSDELPPKPAYSALTGAPGKAAARSVLRIPPQCR